MGYGLGARRWVGSRGSGLAAFAGQWWRSGQTDDLTSDESGGYGDERDFSSQSPEGGQD
jgi:hypothetical protein